MKGLEGKSCVIEDAGHPTRGCVMSLVFLLFSSLSAWSFVLIGYRILTNDFPLEGITATPAMPTVTHVCVKLLGIV